MHWFYIILFSAISFNVSCNNDAPTEEENPIQENPIDPPIEETTTFKNPVLDAAPDPWVFKDDQGYFVTFTTGINITLVRTSKMSELDKGESKIVWTPPSIGLNSAEIWAPELHKINNVWYIYYAASDGNNENHRMWVLENASQDPLEGTWTDRGVLNLPQDKWAIDGSPFEVDGQLYFVWSGWEGDVNIRQDIYIAEMEDPLTVVGDRVTILKPSAPWETNGTNPQVVEAPQILFRGNTVFLFYSAGGCWTDGYSIGAAFMDIADNPLVPGSWTKLDENPLFTSNVAGNSFGPGHNSFFRSRDGTEDWILYHANPQSGQGCGNFRSARIQQMDWDDNGFPLLGQPKGLLENLDKPSGEE